MEPQRTREAEMGRRKSVLEKQLEAVISKESAKDNPNAREMNRLVDRLLLERGTITKDEFFGRTKTDSDTPEKVKTAAEQQEADTTAQRHRELDALAERAATVINSPVVPYVPAPVKTPEELAEELRLKRKQEQEAEEKRTTEDTKRRIREQREAIQKREDALPKLKMAAVQNAYVRWTSDPAREADLHIHSMHPSYNELRDNGVVQVKDAAGRIATLTSSAQFPGVMVPPGHLRVLRVEQSKLASLPEATE
jgi:hypothetical protein